MLWGPVASGERRAAHATLLRAAAELSGSPPHRIGMDYEAGGRPRLTGPAAGLHVSVSHSRGARAVALSTHAPVGVDVETVRPLPALRMARRWLAPADADWLTRLPHPERVRAFYWLWTQKEAVGKARGHGLADGGLTQRLPAPAHWPPHPRPGGPGTLPALNPLPDGTGTACAVLPTGRGPHVLAVACLDGADIRIDLRRCER